MLHVTAVEHRHPFQVRLQFNDGALKDVDLSGELHGEVFEPLRDQDYFRRGALNVETGTVEWPNGADFAPEFLYERGSDVQQVA